MARFYANENFPFPAVLELRGLGHDVLTIQETGRGNQAVEDHEVLAFATREARALLTINRRHFVRLHTEHSHHAGIVVCTIDPDFAGLAQRIHQACASLPDLAGRLIRIHRPAK